MTSTRVWVADYSRWEAIGISQPSGNTITEDDDTGSCRCGQPEDRADVCRINDAAGRFTEPSADAHALTSPSPTCILRNEKLRNEKDLSCQTSLFSIGGGHGTRTHGALPPYLISNQAP